MKLTKKNYKKGDDHFYFYFQLMLALLMIASAELSYWTTIFVMLGTAAIAVLGNHYILHPISKKNAVMFSRIAGIITFGLLACTMYSRVTIGAYEPYSFAGIGVVIQFMYYYMDEYSRIWSEEKAIIPKSS